jgi:hypothetical protein
MCLNRALAAENLSFPTYALLNAVAEHDGPITMTEMSLVTGYSYWAVRNQIRRTPWFENIGGANHSAVILTHEAKVKLAAVRKRVETDNM